MNILAFAATNHQKSINKQLVHYVLEQLQAQQPDATADIIDLAEYELPLYRQDREEEGGVPAKAQEFYDKIGAADLVIASFAEHNGLYTAVYKNLFDWASRIDQKVYQDTPMIAMAASPGGRGGAGVLGVIEQTAPFFGMDIKATVSVPTFQKNFDAEKAEITNADIQQQIQAAISAAL